MFQVFHVQFGQNSQDVYDTALSEAETLSMDVVHFSADRRFGPKLHRSVLRNQER